MFSDRTDAGRQLAAALERFRGLDPLVLGLPRGGVVVAAEVARTLDCDLDVLLIKKLRAAANPEFALGAVSEQGQVFLNDEILRMTGTTAKYLQHEIDERKEEICAQQKLYRKARPAVSPKERTTIIVDDGLATGATMLAAVRSVRVSQPRQLVVAVPVAAPDALGFIKREADAVVCLWAPDGFQGVGQFYEDFSQVDDETVAASLKEFS